MNNKEFGFVRYIVLLITLQFLSVASCYAAAGGHSTHDSSVWDLKFYFINFLIYLALVAFIIKRVAPQGWAMRRQRIQESLQASIAKVSAAERAYQTAKQRLQTLDEDARALTEQMQREAEREAGEVIESAKNQGARMVKQAHDNANAERKASETAIRKEYAAQALRIAEERLRKEVTPERDRSIRTEFQNSLKELIH